MRSLCHRTEPLFHPQSASRCRTWAQKAEVRSKADIPPGAPNEIDPKGFAQHPELVEGPQSDLWGLLLPNAEGCGFLGA